MEKSAPLTVQLRDLSLPQRQSPAGKSERRQLPNEDNDTVYGLRLVMVRRFLILLIVAAAAASGNPLCARQSDGLTPISPAEEQGKRRSVLIGFRAGHSAQEREALPPPQTPTSQDPAGEPEDITPEERRLPAGSGTEEIRQRYPDGSPQIVRNVRQDADGNYVNHGPWKLYNRRGQVLAEGEFVDGLMHGTWVRWHPDGDPAIQALWQNSARSGPYQSIASFSDGKLEGSWIVYDRLRKKIFEMQYVAGERHGPAMWWDPSGRLVREARFEHGVLDGRLIEYDENNRPARETVYVRGQRVYSEVDWYSAGKKKSEDFYLDGKMELAGEDDWWDAKPAEYVRQGTPIRHGATRAWYENGQPRMSGQFEQGKRHGTFTWWHPNGQRELIGVYQHGIRNGGWTWWHSNGMKAVQGMYEQDEPYGEWVYWNTDGQVVRRAPLGQNARGLEHSLAEPAEELPPATKVPSATSDPPAAAQSPSSSGSSEEIEELAPPRNDDPPR